MTGDDESGSDRPLAPVADLDTWLRDARTAQAVADRARRHWLAQQAAAGATLAGVLVDLAERGRPAVLHTVGGRAWRGTVEGVGGDVVALRTDGGSLVLLTLASIAALRADPAGPATGDRAAPIDLTMHGALAEAVAERPHLQLGCGAAEPVAGMLVEVGDELVAVCTDVGDVVHVPLAVIDVAQLR